MDIHTGCFIGTSYQKYTVSIQVYEKIKPVVKQMLVRDLMHNVCENAGGNRGRHGNEKVTAAVPAYPPAP